MGLFSRKKDPYKDIDLDEELPLEGQAKDRIIMEQMKENDERAKELFDWVTNHADNMNFLPEQIERNGHNTALICSLAWSHATYIIVSNELKMGD